MDITEACTFNRDEYTCIFFTIYMHIYNYIQKFSQLNLNVLILGSFLETGLLEFWYITETVYRKMLDYWLTVLKNLCLKLKLQSWASCVSFTVFIFTNFVLSHFWESSCQRTEGLFCSCSCLVCGIKFHLGINISLVSMSTIFLGSCIWGFDATSFLGIISPSP